MPKITEEKLTKVLCLIFDEDVKYLKILYKGNIGVNKAIRTIVRSFVKQSKAKANAAIDEIEILPTARDE